jgi:hypothetical protein
VYEDKDDRGDVWADAQGKGEWETGWSNAPETQGSAIVSVIKGATPDDKCPCQASEGCGDGGSWFG